MEKFKSIFIVLSVLLVTKTYSRQKFDFELGSNLQVISDKAFRRSKENKFEAIGNVIISYKDNTIYGEKASVALNEGNIKVFGNVRFIAPEASFFGSGLFYNYKNQELELQNARVLSDNYVVLGDKIKVKGRKEIHAENAEYSTCKDCPESWSILGNKVHVTVGEYVRIWGAYIKIKGTVVMYVPYILFPIKQERESGLLSPGVSLSFEDGVRFQQPFFWAINESSDLTFTPSAWGKRGFGSEFEFRHALGEKSWYEFNFLNLWDNIYSPDTHRKLDNGEERFRFIGSFEQHYSTQKLFNQHFRYSAVNDLDMFKDFDFSVSSNQLGSQIGFNGFFEFRFDKAYFGLEAGFNRNLLFTNPKGFDDRYVQVLPKVNFSIAPVSLSQKNRNYFKKMYVGLDGDFTNFKQNNYSENLYIRNAMRLNLRPYINWDIGFWKNIEFKNKTTWDQQLYHFPSVNSGDSDYSKRVLVHQTSATIEFEKIFGKAAIEQKEHIIKKMDSVEDNEGELIAKLPDFIEQEVKETETIVHTAVKHNQTFSLIHHYLSTSKESGNKQFQAQIREVTGAGQFDGIDAIRANENDTAGVEARKLIPPNNTIELQWNNYFVKKTPKGNNQKYLRDRFDYHQFAFFNISQGYRIGKSELPLDNRLTRLKIESNYSFDTFSLSANEFYFYDSNKHIFNFSIYKNWERLMLSFGIQYDSFSSTPTIQQLLLSSEVKPFDWLHFGTIHDYNWQKERFDRSKYTMVYIPQNNCWKASFSYEKNLDESRFGFNLLINFNENNYQSLSDL